MYTKAIEINPKAMYYANRSIAHLREEYFGAALQDAMDAIKVDPSYIKGYYRRAAAHMSLGKFKLALSDFELVAKRCPKDPEAQKKFVECNKIVKKAAFEKAISVDQPKQTLADMFKSLQLMCKFTKLDGGAWVVFEESLCSRRGLVHRTKTRQRQGHPRIHGRTDGMVSQPKSVAQKIRLQNPVRHRSVLFATTLPGRHPCAGRGQVHHLR
jgi:tetratricopeptide (TPR) repeat protein